ncbi:MAG: hypothetical protein ACREEB_07875 [Caulobacteraceae bacterium]
MSETPEQKRGRLWLTVGEGAAVLAVVIAALSYWDSHRAHVDEAMRDAAAARQASLASALVLEASVADDGRQLTLKTAAPGQVIESQRYVFPRQIHGGAVDVTAAAPQIDAGWISAGLAKALDARHVKAEGQGRLPVAILTSYVENGVTRRDSALYLIGYAWKRRFLGGREISLSGVALSGRLAAGDPQAAVDKAWAGAG